MKKAREERPGQNGGVPAGRPQRLAPGLLRQPVHLLAFGFGAGLSPWAPGTIGTLIAVPIVALVMRFGLLAHVAWTICTALAGIYLCGESARRLQAHDHPGIVWDEMVGFSVTMLAASQEWYWLAGGFILFRLFDIIKPWPIREADHRLSGGFGIMLDDIIAGIFAAAILLGARLLL